MNAVAQELKHQFDSLTQQAPVEPLYEFTHDEKWNTILQGLPRTCRLWRQFQQLETARTAYEVEQAKRDRWYAEQRKLGALLHHTDPDTESGEVFGANYWRSQQLEYAIKRQAEHLAALKTKADRAYETWTQVWQEYARLRSQHLATTSQTPAKRRIPGAFYPEQEESGRLRAELQRFEGA